MRWAQCLHLRSPCLTRLDSCVQVTQHRSWKGLEMKVMLDGRGKDVSILYSTNWNNGVLVPILANLKASSRGVRAHWDSPSGDRCTGLHYFCAPLYLVNIGTCSPSSLLLPPKHGGIFPALHLSAALVKPLGMKNLMRNLS